MMDDCLHEEKLRLKVPKESNRNRSDSKLLRVYNLNKIRKKFVSCSLRLFISFPFFILMLHRAWIWRKSTQEEVFKQTKQNKRTQIETGMGNTIALITQTLSSATHRQRDKLKTKWNCEFFICFLG